MPNIATVQVFDFETLTGDPTATFPAAAVGALIEATLTFNQVNSVSPASNLQAMKVSTVTDTTGRWQLNLVPNGNINPSGTLWTIKTPTQSYQISVPNSGPVQSSTIKVNAPVSFGAPSSTTGTLTVQGLLTAQAGLTVAGPVTLPAASVPVADLSGVLPVANGGTGSGTQNFVDLSTNQTIAGNKTFSGNTVNQVAWKFRAYANAGQSITANTWTRVAFQVKDFDPNNNFDNVTNFRYTAPVTGYYLLGGSVAITTTGGIRQIVSIYTNGVETSRINDAGAGTGTAGSIGGSIVQHLNANDAAELWTFVGGTATGLTGNPLVYFFAHYLSS